MVLKLTLENDGGNYSGLAASAAPRLDRGKDPSGARADFLTPVRVYVRAAPTLACMRAGRSRRSSIPRRFHRAEFRRALDAMLPADIVVLDIAPAPDNFNPRAPPARACTNIASNRKVASAFDNRYSWLVRDRLESGGDELRRRSLSANTIRRVRSLGTEVRTTVRRVIASRWTRDADVSLHRVEA